MSETLSIGRFRARYHLSATRAPERGRLDRILDDMLEGPGEVAIDSGADADELICVRSVAAPLRVSLDAPDKTIAAAWRSAVSDAVADAVRSERSTVVRYRTRRHALLDLLLGVARGDLDHAWAWRQLGLWKAPDGATGADVADGVTEALASAPEAIVALLREVADHGMLPPLLDELGPHRLAALAASAAAGRHPASRPVRLDRQQGDDAGAPDIQAVARSVVRRSRITAAAADALPLVLLPDARRAIAVLALLEVEPALLGDANVAVAVHAAVSDALRPELRPSPTLLDRQARRSDSRSVLREVASASGAGEELDVDALEAPAPPHARAAEPADEPPAGGHEALEPGAAGATEARTEHGGLLFLVNVLDNLDLVTELAAAAARRGRSSRWVLHQLAQELAPVEPHDPAALAFAGLAPSTTPPDDGEPRPVESEELSRVAERVAAEVRRLLDREGGEAGEAADVLALVTRRTAVVTAEPGWIDIELSLDDVDTDVRRAGLDRDPGWVPWLGVVLRFVYV